MLRHHGLDISEPMAFGIGNGLSFAYLPVMKMGNLPVISYRMVPGVCIKTVSRRLGAKLFYKRFSAGRQREAMDFLDARLEAGQVVGLQTSAYFTTYFPPEMRFQFNGHNIIVYGKEGTTYQVSDPVFERPVTIEYDDLRKARFARGFGAPKGLVHYPLSVPEEVDFTSIILKSVKGTRRMMLHSPWLFGIRGMHCLARVIERLPATRGERYAHRFVGHMVRMQEEIGTGGGGFRFLYAAFLGEAAKIVGSDTLREASEMMTAVGDRWRFFAASCASAIRHRDRTVDCTAIARELRECAEEERKVYRHLAKAAP